VIGADVEVLDLDPQQWAVLHEIVLEARRVRTWWYVLHSGGRVVSRHPAEVPMQVGDVVDLDGLAGRLLAAGRPDRVVLMDRDALPAIGHAAAGLVERDGDLTTYREKVDELYWSSAAVVTAPGAPANPWRQMRLAAESIGAGHVHVLVVGDDQGDDVITAVALTVAGGSVVRVSSPSPSAPDPDVVLALSRADLVRALVSDDLVGRLLTAASGHPLSRGLDPLGIAFDDITVQGGTASVLVSGGKVEATGPTGATYTVYSPAVTPTSPSPGYYKFSQ
jgi:hypothetical protein